MQSSNENRDPREGLRIAVVTSTFLPDVNGIVTLLVQSMAPLRTLGHKVLKAFADAIRSLPRMAFKMSALGKSDRDQMTGLASLIPQLGVSAGAGAEDTEAGGGITELEPARAPLSPRSAKRNNRMLKIATWNIAYGRGNGPDDNGPWARELITKNLNAVAELVRSTDLDMVALQEVDFGSARTHDIDQARYIAERAGLPHLARITTWQRNFVPYPLGRADRSFDRIWSGQCVISKYPILSNRGQDLGALRFKPYWYQLFSMAHRVQHCRIQWNSKPIDVLNVHLERYSPKDRVLQARRLAEIVASVGPARALVLGDFNAPCLSSGKLHGFEDDPRLDFRNDTTLGLIRDRGLRLVTDPNRCFCSVMTLSLVREWGRNLVTEPKGPFYTVPAASPTRGVDHILLGKDLEVVEADVLKEASLISDHLPVVARIRA